MYAANAGPMRRRFRPLPVPVEAGEEGDEAEEDNQPEEDDNETGATGSAAFDNLEQTVRNIEASQAQTGVASTSGDQAAQANPPPAPESETDKMRKRMIIDLYFKHAVFGPKLLNVIDKPEPEVLKTWNLAQLDKLLLNIRFVIKSSSTVDAIKAGIDIAVSIAETAAIAQGKECEGLKNSLKRDPDWQVMEDMIALDNADVTNIPLPFLILNTVWTHIERLDSNTKKGRKVVQPDNDEVPQEVLSMLQ